GHIAFTGMVGADRVVFCGDTLFACGCGKLFEGTPAQMWSSLQKLAALAPATKVFCGHEYTVANIRFARMVEPDNQALLQREAREQGKRARGAPTLPSTIGEELATNPFLRADRPDVRAVAQAQSQQSIVDAIGSFAALRAWKNRT
ncbi:MAG TPA: hydroxyacylglutathione hydrolase C-terminal domain-containing protein, partial [Casimicrobiaceae bacterium]|nr:hydroxyacylglutathione hydrolase C-terminal domain-containing protein [Casimicrobiaceae bacterium]